MVEYIKKDEAIKLIREDKVEITPNLLTIAMLAAPNGYSAEDCYKAINDTCDRHIKEIRNLPAADVVERKKGEWLEDFNGFETIYRCSKCSEEPLTKYGTMHDYVLSEFCPHCGADMREESLCMTN